MVWPLIAVAAIGAVTQIAGGVMGQRGAKQAAEAQEELIEMTYQENRRRMMRDNKRTLGDAVSRVYASNVKFEGTSRDYVYDMNQEQQAQLRWLKKEADLRAKAGLDAAKTAGQASMVSGIGGAASSISGGFMGAGQSQGMFGFGKR